MKKSGSIHVFTMSLAALAGYGAAVLLMEAPATTVASTAIESAYEGPAAYLPAQYVNQALEIEPMQHYSYY
jgi:hypothetical protein